MQSLDEGLVDLQHRLAAGHHKQARPSDAAQRPLASLGEVSGGFELASARTIGADEIGIAELAHGVAAIFLASRPQVAASEAAEHRRRSGIGAFALERVENLFDGIHG